MFLVVLAFVLPFLTLYLSLIHILTLPTKRIV